MLRATAYHMLQEAQGHIVRGQTDAAHGRIEAVKMELTHGEDVSMTIVRKHPMTVELGYGVVDRLQWLASRSNDPEDNRLARELYKLLMAVDDDASDLEGRDG